MEANGLYLIIHPIAKRKGGKVGMFNFRIIAGKENASQSGINNHLTNSTPRSQRGNRGGCFRQREALIN